MRSRSSRIESSDQEKAYELPLVEHVWADVCLVFFWVRAVVSRGLTGLSGGIVALVVSGVELWLRVTAFERRLVCFRGFSGCGSTGQV